MGICLDCYEVIANSPRLLAIFTICYTSRVKFIGKVNSINAAQYWVIRDFPFYISWLSCADMLIRRNMILTLDDFLFLMLTVGIQDIQGEIPEQILLVSPYELDKKAKEKAASENKEDL